MNVIEELFNKAFYIKDVSFVGDSYKEDEKVYITEVSEHGEVCISNQNLKERERLIEQDNEEEIDGFAWVDPNNLIEIK